MQDEVLHQKAQELAALNALSRAVNASLSLDHTAAAALNGMLHAVSPDLSFLFLRDDQRLVLKLALPGPAQQRLNSIPEHRVGECLCGLAVLHGKPIYSRDIFNDCRCSWKEYKEAGLKSFAALPLISGPEVIGVIGLASAEERDFAKQAHFLETLAGQVSTALANARLFEAAQRELMERKRAQEALRLSEERFRTLVETASDWIWEVDAAGRYTYASPQVKQLLGFDPEEIMGKEPADFMPPEEALRVRAMFSLMAQHKLPISSFENINFHKNGQRLVLETSGVPILDAAGNLTGYRGIDRNVTQRKQADLAIRENERKYRELVENANCIILRWNPQGQVTFLNEFGQVFFGFAESDILGQHVIGTIVPQNESTGRDLRPLMDQICADPKAFQHNVNENMRRDGNRVWISWTNKAVFDAQGHLVEVLSVGTDITERRKAEQETAEWKQRYDLLALSAGNIVYDCSATSDKISWGGSVQEILGYAIAELNGGMEQWQSLVHPEDRVRAVRLYREASDKGAMFQAEYRFRHKDGRYLLIQDSGYPLFDPQRHVERFIGVMVDITERRKADDDRMHLEAQLLQAQKMEMVGRLAGGVAHDFNNMLQAILGNATLALAESSPGTALHECLEEIQKSAERSADLTRQLLAFARKQTISPKILDLNDIVSGMLKMLRRLIGEHIQLLWAPGPALWPVRVDPSQIDQILANLALNSRDAIAGSGTVSIQTSNVTLDEVFNLNHPDCVPGDYVMLSVNDNGQGMDAATRAHLFEPFFTTKEVGKGTGLGLATVFGIVKQNHGVITVQSELGQGTTFKLYLPRAEMDTEVATQDRIQRNLRGTETVLLVEDELQVLNLGQRILRHHGYSVLAAPVPATALALAAQHQGTIDLLITDVVMPEMNGKELWARLQVLHPGLKCLFMSGYTSDIIAHHGILDEGVDFLQKPFTIQTLAEKVRCILDD
jgi:two-component system, cell cycle sensor histidine kinase and response regulator CckA